MKFFIDQKKSDRKLLSDGPDFLLRKFIILFLCAHQDSNLEPAD